MKFLSIIILLVTVISASDEGKWFHVAENMGKDTIFIDTSTIRLTKNDTYKAVWKVRNFPKMKYLFYECEYNTLTCWKPGKENEKFRIRRETAEEYALIFIHLYLQNKENAVIRHKKQRAHYERSNKK